MGSVPGVKVNRVKLLLAGGSAQGSSVGRSTLTDASLSIRRRQDLEQAVAVLVRDGETRADVEDVERARAAREVLQNALGDQRLS